MKRFIFILSVLVSGFIANTAQAQSDARTHFIYIQSENQQPYYVILNNKSYSSSSVGYLIISKLTDGDYKITIGFPQDAYPASTYLLKISGTDAGFQLRKGSGKKWDLFDKLSQKALAVTDADGSTDASAIANSDNGGKKGNGFGDLLSKTSNDTTNYQAYAAPAQDTNNGDVAKATMPASNKSVESVVKKGRTRAGAGAVKTAEANDGKKTVDLSNDANDESYETAAARSATQSIVKIGEHSDRRGISLTFVVTSGEKIDTVSTFFPGDSKKSILEGEDDTVVNDNINTASVSPEKVALKKEVDGRKATDNPFYKGATETKSNNDLSLFSDTDDNPKNTKKADNAKDDNADVKNQNADSKEIFNSTCTSMVSDRDLDRIRKKMISKSTDEEMIAIARKYVDTKCIYTSQIKELGGLLISDSGRFALYRILYPNVYDGNQFKTLEDQLLDKNYKAQFETLVGSR
ncbi:MULTISPECIES: DUF4476 domain-containing protein [Chitinophagaceae]